MRRTTLLLRRDAERRPCPPPRSRRRRLPRPELLPGTNSSAVASNFYPPLLPPSLPHVPYVRPRPAVSAVCFEKATATFSSVHLPFTAIYYSGQGVHFTFAILITSYVLEFSMLGTRKQANQTMQSRRKIYFPPLSCLADRICCSCTSFPEICNSQLLKHIASKFDSAAKMKDAVFRPKHTNSPR